jgi:hypothetical protein
VQHTGVLQEVLQNRQGYTPTATGGAPGPAAPKAVKETKPANAPIKKAPAASAAPQSSGVEKIQKIADDQKLERLKAQRDEYTKRWVEASRKGNKEEAEKALAVRNFVSKEYDDFKKEYDDKYNRPVAKSPKELMDQEAKRIRDRIQSRIEEGTSNMPKETGDSWKANREKEYRKFKNLSDDELAAMGLYGENKSKYYMDVNKFLRTGSMEGIPPERQQIVRNIAWNLNGALNKLPASSETNFERAVSGPGARGLRNLKVGDIIEDKGFGSYTLAGKPVTLDQFFRQKEDNAVMRVTSRNARNVAPVMEFQREAEHILRPGTKLRVTEVIEANAPGAHRSRAVGSIPTYTFEEVE